MGRAEALESRPYLRTPGSRYPIFLHKNIQVGTFFRNVRLILITRRDPSNSTDGLESRPYLRTPGSRYPIFLRRNVQVGTFFRNVRLSLITRRNPSNSTDGLESALRRPRTAIQPSIQMRGRRSAPSLPGGCPALPGPARMNLQRPLQSSALSSCQRLSDHFLFQSFSE